MQSVRGSSASVAVGPHTGLLHNEPDYSLTITREAYTLVAESFTG